MNKTIGNDPDYLLISLRRGDEVAFDFLFRKYYKAACAQANIYLKDIDLSESLVQECFIKLWQKRTELDQILNFPSYFSSMVRNKCLDCLRRRKLQGIDESEADNCLCADSFEADVPLLYHEFEEKLLEALSELPERCRIAFEYSRLEGLTYTEIAQKMGISVKAVEALISRSLKILRLRLKDYLPFFLFFISSVFHRY